MPLFGYKTKSEKNLESKIESYSKELTAIRNEQKDIKASRLEYPLFPTSPILRTYFDGEKTIGEMGAPKDYVLLYPYLRARSWQSYLESEVTQAIVNKYVLWVVGNGLKPQPEPDKDVLASEGIEIDDLRQFQRITERRWSILAADTASSHNGMKTLNQLEWTAMLNAIVGGDVLCINRVKNGIVTSELIDGAYVLTPPTTDKLYVEAIERGHVVSDGVELSKTGEHIAYFVYAGNNTYQRILRKGSRSGRVMAYLVYGSQYRLNSHRGMPLLSATLEKLKKLDRYQEATVGAAEQTAKILFALEKDDTSSDENIFANKIKNAQALNFGESPETKTSLSDQMEQTSTKIAGITQNAAFDLPIGVKLKSFQGEKELNFKEFYETNAAAICAAMGIPFEVAWSMYNSNYSASRAAIKDWEHTLKVRRNDFSIQFHKPRYILWLDMEISMNKIQALGYIQALIDKNIMALGAYRNVRWLGASVPNIDPLKEIKAIRERLGDKNTPLGSYDQATEELGSGDFSQIQEKVSQELDMIADNLDKREPIEKTKNTTVENG